MKKQSTVKATLKLGESKRDVVDDAKNKKDSTILAAAKKAVDSKESQRNQTKKDATPKSIMQTV